MHSAQKSQDNSIENDFDRVVECLASSVIRWEAVTPRKLVADFELCKLYVYPTEANTSQVTSANVVLLIYAMVNTASILDLRKNTSTIERLKQQGLTVYLMEWKPPEHAQSSIGMAEYLERSVHHCVRYIRDVRQLDKINLMGICQGGVLSLCYAAMYPDLVRSLIPVVTPVDFYTEDDTLSRLARHLDLDQIVPSGVNISGQVLAQVFLSLKPMTLSIQKYLDIAEDLTTTTDAKELAETFMAMEQWINTTHDQPAAFFKEFVSLLYQKNALCDGSLKLADMVIDLKKMTIPVFNVYAFNDHLVPPESSKALGNLIPKQYYQSLEVPTGHIGMFVSQKSLNHVPKAIADFIRQV